MPIPSLFSPFAMNTDCSFSIYRTFIFTYSAADTEFMDHNRLLKYKHLSIV